MQSSHIKTAIQGNVWSKPSQVFYPMEVGGEATRSKTLSFALGINVCKVVLARRDHVVVVWGTRENISKVGLAYA